MSHLVRMFALAILAPICCGCSVSSPPPLSSARSNAYFQSLLSNTPHKVEALAWLRTADGKVRIIGDSSDNLNATKSLQMVRDLYAAGAIHVIAIDIETDTHLETTSTLIVELPVAPAARKCVFATEAQAVKSTAFDPTPDTGQKYLMLHW